jgi:hypothetical protein
LAIFLENGVTMNGPSDNIDDDNLASSIASAFDDLPVVARLRFVKNLIFDHGGDKISVPKDSKLVLSVEILTSVIDDLEKGPVGSRLPVRRPMPDPN